MKYGIYINQYAAVTNGFDLDIIDLAIFDFIKDLANSSHCIRINTKEGEYMAISDKLISEQMPILQIKTKWGVLKHINRLIDAGLLERHPNCKELAKPLYKLGKNYDKLVFSNSNSERSDLSTNVDTPYQQMLIPLSTNVDTPYQQTLTNNINKGYNNITYNNYNPPTPRGDFGQSENCPLSSPQSVNENSFSNLVDNGTPAHLNTSAQAENEKEKSSAKKEKEIEPILGGLFGMDSNSITDANKVRKTAEKQPKNEVAELLKNFWNNICVPVGFAEVKKLNKARIEKAAQVVKEMQEDGVSAQDLFDKITKAVALYEGRSNGGSEGSWFDFDWVISKRKGQFDPNWKMIMSGKYDRSFRRVDGRTQSLRDGQRAVEFMAAAQEAGLEGLALIEAMDAHAANGI